MTSLQQALLFHATYPSSGSKRCYKLYQRVCISPACYARLHAKTATVLIADSVWQMACEKATFDIGLKLLPECDTQHEETDSTCAHNQGTITVVGCKLATVTATEASTLSLCWALAGPSSQQILTLQTTLHGRDT